MSYAVPTTINVHEIITPDESHQLRPQINLAHIEQMVKESRDSIKAGHWPFPPIVVRAVQMQDGSRRYETIDGHHRVGVARRLGRDSIPAQVYYELTADQAMVMAWHLNGSLKLDRDARDKMVRTLREVHLYSVMQVAEMTGLSTASVSRIARHAQRVSEGAGRQTRRQEGVSGIAVPPTPDRAIKLLQTALAVLATDERADAALAAMDGRKRRGLVTSLRQVADKVARVRSAPAPAKAAAGSDTTEKANGKTRRPSRGK